MLPGVRTAQAGRRPQASIADVRRADDAALAQSGMNSVGPISSEQFVANKQANDEQNRVSGDYDNQIRSLIEANVRASIVNGGTVSYDTIAAPVEQQLKIYKEAVAKHPELRGHDPQTVANEVNRLGDLQSDPETIRNIRKSGQDIGIPLLQGFKSSVGSTVRALGNLADVVNAGPQSTKSQSLTDTANYLKEQGRGIEEGQQVSDLIDEPQNRQERFQRSLLRGVGATPGMIAKFEAFGIPTMIAEGGLSRADEGIGGVLKGAAESAISLYGMQATGKVLSPLVNAFTWTAIPTAKGVLIDHKDLPDALGESIPGGVLAGLSGKGANEPGVVESRFREAGYEPYQVRSDAGDATVYVSPEGKFVSFRSRRAAPGRYPDRPIVEVSPEAFDRITMGAKPGQWTKGLVNWGRGAATDAPTVEPREIAPPPRQLAGRAEVSQPSTQTEPQTPPPFNSIADQMRARGQEPLAEPQIAPESVSPVDATANMPEQSEGEQLHYSNAQNRRVRNVATGNKGQFKKGFRDANEGSAERVEGVSESSLLPISQGAGVFPATRDVQNAEASAPSVGQTRQAEQATERQLPTPELGAGVSPSEGAKPGDIIPPMPNDSPVVSGKEAEGQRGTSGRSLDFKHSEELSGKERRNDAPFAIFRIQDSRFPLPERSRDYWDTDTEHLEGVSGFGTLLNASRDMLSSKDVDGLGVNYAENVKDEGGEPILSVFAGTDLGDESPNVNGWSVEPQRETEIRFTPDEILTAWKRAVLKEFPHDAESVAKMDFSELDDSYQLEDFDVDAFHALRDIAASKASPSKPSNAPTIRVQPASVEQPTQVEVGAHGRFTHLLHKSYPHPETGKPLPAFLTEPSVRKSVGLPEVSSDEAKSSAETQRVRDAIAKRMRAPRSSYLGVNGFQRFIDIHKNSLSNDAIDAYHATVLEHENYSQKLDGFLTHPIVDRILSEAQDGQIQRGAKTQLAQIAKQFGVSKASADAALDRASQRRLEASDAGRGSAEPKESTPPVQSENSRTESGLRRPATKAESSTGESDSFPLARRTARVEANQLGNILSSPDFVSRANSLAQRPIEEVIKGIKFSSTAPHRIKVNAQAYLALHGAYNSIESDRGRNFPGFTGVFNDPAYVTKLTNKLNEAANYYKRAGRPLWELSQAIKQAAKSDGTVILYRDDSESAIRHEEGHRSSYLASQGKGLEARHGHFQRVYRSPEMQKARTSLLEYYPDVPGVLVEEAYAHIIEGNYEAIGLSEDEAARFLRSWRISFEAKNGRITASNFGDTYEPLERITEGNPSEVRTSSRAESGQVSTGRDRSLQEVSQGAGKESASDASEALTKVDTNTPAFKRWFGSSKVVDERGEPLVVYHGTNARFNIFDKGKFNTVESSGDYVGEGFFFTTSRYKAEQFAKQAVEKHGGEPHVISAYLSIKNPFVPKKGMFGAMADEELQGYFKRSPNSLRAELESQGHDGLIDSDYGQFAVFDSTQIKSVNNQGTFDPSDPNILRKSDKSSDAISNFQLIPEKMPPPRTLPPSPRQSEAGFINLPSLKNLKNTAVSLANLPRAVMTSFDLSAPLRQGAIFTLTEPKLAVKAFADMIRGISSKRYATFKQQLDLHPMIELAEESGLHLTSLAGDKLEQKEEVYMSNLAEKIPGVKQSEQAYVSYLDSIRMGAFEKYAKEMGSAGITSPESYKAIARFINAATGRGDLGKTLNNAAPILNSIFFSPRYLASRIQLMNPVEYMKMPAAARKIAMRKMFEFAALIGLTLFLLKQSGADVNLTNPDSPDWLKVKLGNTRYDFLAGFQQPARFAYRLAESFNRRRKGERLSESEQPSSIIGKFLRSKENPGFSLLHDYVSGKDFNGELFRLLPGKDKQGEMKAGAIGSRLIPIIVQDAYEGYKDAGGTGIARTLPATMLGVGVQTYSPNNRSTIRPSGAAPKPPSAPRPIRRTVN
jgi:hypothetical protein